MERIQLPQEILDEIRNILQGSPPAPDVFHAGEIAQTIKSLLIGMVIDDRTLRRLIADEAARAGANIEMA